MIGEENAMTDTEYKVLSDGRRLDVLLSEETGLSRSRVAALMEEGLCVSGALLRIPNFLSK